MDIVEELKGLLSDDSVHVAIGIITKLVVADDKASLKVLLNVFPEEREIVARMSWEVVGPESGFFAFPSVNDLVLVALAEGDNDQAFVIKRLTSREDKIPVNALEGDTVLKTLEGKKLWLTSSKRINLSKGDIEPTENLVLGQVFKVFAAALLDQVKKLAEQNKAETHIGNLGFNTSVPNNATQYQEVATAVNNLKSNPINNDTILSDTSFTEK